MVTNDVAIVTVRNSSSRLPGKPLLKIYEKFCSIDIVIERAKKIGIPVILATSKNSEDNIFEEIAKIHNVEIFRGSLLNKIKRWNDCFKKFKIDNALLIDGDDLAYDFEIGKRALTKLQNTKVDLIINPKNIVCGFFTYAISKNGISKLFKYANSDLLDTDVITKFIELAKLKTEKIELYDFEQDKKVRLTLDYNDDLEFFRILYKELNIMSSGYEIINYLEKNKNVAEKNFHRQKDFLKNQEKFNEEIKI